MARVAGRMGRIYLAQTTTGQAEPMVAQAKWSINQTSSKQDVTALGDTTKQYVADTPDATGTFEGFFDDAADSTYKAAVDGLPRRFYLYPNVNTPTVYWYGQILPDLTIAGGVGTAVTVSSSWSAASSIVKQG
ncbi:hypothetical protein [Klenkia brasiliensis]|uniref:Uncharacterized protein n=1 Tax=Klenkia brasiliensis TaxID=333142 RepID=A0A1G7YFP6_9ACTN|nr:hypothetical protein [Klenkia brasiliensis]SDG95157.1 hypothetical protein SAMN05660324_3936 [Klenkia brasiliensis]